MSGQPALDPDPLTVGVDDEYPRRLYIYFDDLKPARHDYFRRACFGFFLGFVACLILNGLVPR